LKFITEVLQGEVGFTCSPNPKAFDFVPQHVFATSIGWCS
jgi:hypothetical protein